MCWLCPDVTHAGQRTSSADIVATFEKKHRISASALAAAALAIDSDACVDPSTVRLPHEAVLSLPRFLAFAAHKAVSQPQSIMLLLKRQGFGSGTGAVVDGGAVGSRASGGLWVSCGWAWACSCRRLWTQCRIAATFVAVIYAAAGVSCDVLLSSLFVAYPCGACTLFAVGGIGPMSSVPPLSLRDSLYSWVEDSRHGP